MPEFSGSPDIWNSLWDENTSLTPDALRKFIKPYQHFQKSDEYPLIWSKTGSITRLGTNPGIIGIYGPTSAGKDTLMQGIAIPHFRIHTTTTRHMRTNDPDGEKYYTFLSSQEFIKKLQTNTFLEWMKEVSGYYGTENKEVIEKIQKARESNIPLLLWRGNIEGHLSFAPQVFSQFSMTVPGIFILPDMPIHQYKEHIVSSRGQTEGLKRWQMACAEIEYAPEIVDYFLINPLTEGNGKEQSIAALNILLSDLLSSGA